LTGYHIFKTWYQQIWYPMTGYHNFKTWH
jgi:hypothetical protein